MPKFRVYATYETVLYTEVEAGTAQDAYELAKDIDGGEFVECTIGDWRIESDPELIEETENA